MSAMVESGRPPPHAGTAPGSCPQPERSGYPQRSSVLPASREFAAVAAAPSLALERLPAILRNCGAGCIGRTPFCWTWTDDCLTFSIAGKRVPGAGPGQTLGLARTVRHQWNVRCRVFSRKSAFGLVHQSLVSRVVAQSGPI